MGCADGPVIGLSFESLSNDPLPCLECVGIPMGNAVGIGAVKPGGAGKPGGPSIGKPPRPIGRAPDVCIPGGGKPRKLWGAGWG